MKHPEVLIRKYGDRRLYDTSASRYVNLKDIARMVRDGIDDVSVVDGRSDRNLTHIILTQVIVEDAKEQQIALPLQLLTQLVRASDKATHDFLSWYLDTTLDLSGRLRKRLAPGFRKLRTSFRVRLISCATSWRDSRRHRHRKVVKSKNSAVRSKNCSSVWLIVTRLCAAHLSADLAN